MWDYRAAVVILAGIMIHSGCDIINDIYDIEIDRICKPKGAIASGQISVKNAWGYMILLFSTALILSLNLSLILFACLLTGIIVGGIMYSHPSFRFKDRPGIAMADIALPLYRQALQFFQSIEIAGFLYLEKFFQSFYCLLIDKEITHCLVFIYK